MPYAPYGRGDRLGRSADWNSNGYNRFAGKSSYGAEGVNTVFNFEAEEESEFRLVDSKPVVKKTYGRRFQQRAPSRREREAEEARKAKERNPNARQKLPSKKKTQEMMRWAYWRRHVQQVNYGASLEVKPDWDELATVELKALTAAEIPGGAAPPAQLLASAGILEFYDKKFNKADPKSEVDLLPTKRAFRSVTASRDAILKRLAAQGHGNVFCTDTLLGTLMCAPRSVYSWDIVATKKDGQLWLDKRDTSALEMLTNSETSPEPVPNAPDNINGCQQLAEEATLVNQMYSQQVLTKAKSVRLSEPVPFGGGQGAPPLAGTAYTYKKFAWGPHQLVVRVALDAMLEGKQGAQATLLKALNEFDSRVTGVNWRQKLENQRGAVLATELKNNAFKIGKWCCQALAGGVQAIQFGYVSRAHAKNNKQHVLIGTQTIRTQDLAKQLNLSEANVWGSVDEILGLLAPLADGKYVLMRSPNERNLKLFAVPDGSLEDGFGRA